MKKEITPGPSFNEPANGPPILLTVDEACRRLRVSRWTFYRLVQRGKLKTIHIGRRHLIPSATIDELVDRLRSEAVG
ncbi:helix-turn-helix domain-containing protein [Amycolatopsis sp. NPDC051128]|uniref:helix-turn-helix domain-containing protein n=1 Tax=Amycolatopsis sp. NPDC051128 TaxID=3155412 RepID=UPI003425FCC5